MRCPDCNALMYNTSKGNANYGCPLCFTLFSEEQVKNKEKAVGEFMDIFIISDISDIPDSVDPPDGFKFWTNEDEDSDK